MSLNTETTMQVVPAYGYGGYGGGGMFGGDNAWWIILFLLFGGRNWGGGGNDNSAVQASIAAGFNNSAVLNRLNDLTLGQAGIQQTLCQGFSGVDRSIGELGYKIAIQDCETRTLIQGVGRDIVDNANANTRAILDFLVQSKLADKDAEIARLQGKVERIEQNGVIRAAIDASTAEIIRRTGNECPTPAYWVSPPTPVQVPCNPCGCGGNGFGYGFN